MITVPEATKTIIERSRYLSEAISKGLINYSALARYIKPELEEILFKKVSDASVIMALKRLENEFQPRFQAQKVFKAPPEVNIRSSLRFFSIPNSEVSGLSFLLSRETDSKSYFLKNQGISETSFMISIDLFEKYKVTVDEKNNYLHQESVSALTIYFPDEAIQNSGIYYFFLKSLAWDGINILEVSSTVHEMTLIFRDNDVQTAFSIIKSLFKN